MFSVTTTTLLGVRGQRWRDELAERLTQLSNYFDYLHLFEDELINNVQNAQHVWASAQSQPKALRSSLE